MSDIEDFPGSKGDERKYVQEKQRKGAIKDKSRNTHDKSRTNQNKKYATIDEQRPVRTYVPPVVVLKTSHLKVVDMTGKHMKVFTGYENISQCTGTWNNCNDDLLSGEEPENVKQVKEIIYTLQKELFCIDERLISKKDNLEVLKADFEKLKKSCDDEMADIADMELFSI